MRFASLGSGSRGNALVVEAGTTRVLIDCGFGLRDTTARLGRLGLAPQDLSGVLVTHEHSDHVAGVFKLALHYKLTVWMTRGTFAACAAGEARSRVEAIAVDAAIALGDLEIFPYAVPHDAREPVQCVVSDGRVRLGVLTDSGCATPHIEQCLNGCHALVLECNHDPDLLRTGTYPARLKARIAGRYGHLGNDAAAALLASLDTGRLQHVVAAHLSEQNNRPDLARAALAGALGCSADWIGVADQEEGFAWRDLR